MALSAQEPNEWNSLLWKITGPDLPKPCYLYGTMHVSNKVAYHLTEQFFTALDACEVVALEMDPEQWLPEMVSSPLLAAMGGDRYQMLHDRYRDAFGLDLPDRGRLREVLAHDPQMVNQLLYRMNERASDFEESTFLDLFIFQSARKLGKPVVGLEQFEASMKMLVKSQMPDEDVDESRAEKHWEKLMQAGKDPEELLEDAYRANDLARMDTLHDWMTPNRNTRLYLLDERNKVFMAGMLEVMRRKPLFTGVGAMHLPGENGLIQMLRREGYTVEPVRGRITDRSRARREKLDEQYRPVTLVRRTAPDSTFSIELPAPLEAFPLGMDRNHLLLCADMVNGAYYSVQRIPTYAAFRGRTTTDMLQSIDSLLYETVPGRITERRAITSENGWPGFEIRSSTRLGRELHFKILVSPFDVIVFKRTARPNAQLQKDGERVFNSIRFHEPPGIGAARWTASVAGLSVELPARRSVDATPRTPSWFERLGLRQDVIAQAMEPATGASYLVVAASEPDISYLEEDSFELAVLGEQFAEQMGLKPVRAWAFVSDGRPARCTASINALGDSVYAMVRIDGPRYQLFAVRASGADAGRFFGSVRSEAFRYVRPISLLEDTMLHFTVRTASLHSDMLGLLGGFGDVIRRAMARDNPRTEHPERGETQSLWYVSSDSPEAVNVRYRRFHWFHREESEEKFWEERMRYFTEEDGMVVRSTATAQLANGDPVRDLVLGASASSRAVRVRMVRHRNVLYTLRASVDTLAPPTAWVDTFFTTFLPTDTSTRDLFARHDDEFLDWLAGPDSARRAQARDSWGAVDFAPGSAPRLIALVDTVLDDRKQADTRDRAIEALGGLHHPSVIPHLEKLYTAHSGEARIQLPLLEGLLQQRTLEASRTAARLMEADPPLTDSDRDVHRLFWELHDSLELAVPFYPMLLDLMVFDEYKDDVRNLTAAMLDRGLLEPADAEAYKGQWLMLANAELKRRVNAALDDEENDRNSDFDYDRSYRYYDDDDYRDRGDFEEFEDERYYDDHGSSSAEALLRRKTDRPRDRDRQFEVGPWAPTITAYQHLLLPWYEDPEVKAFYDRCMKGENDDVALRTAALLVHRGRKVDRSFWIDRAKQDDQRFRVLTTLYGLDREDLLPDSLLTLRRNADAYLLDGWQDAGEDSVKFIGMREVTGRFGTADVLVYERRVKNGDKAAWRVGCVGFLRGDTGDPFAHAFEEWSTTRITDRDDLEEEIDELVGGVRYTGRKHWNDRPREYSPWMYD